MEKKKISKKKLSTKKKTISLSPKHMAFVLEYILTNNATKAYMKVYPKSKYDSASVSAHELLRKPKISAYLQNFYDKQWDEKKNEIGRTFAKLLKIANADISDVVEYKDGKMKIINFDDIDTFAVQEIKHSTSHSQYGESVKQSIKMYDKQKAISDLMKALGMITNVEIEGDIVIIPAKRPDRPSQKEKEISE